MKNKYKGLLVVRNRIYDNISEERIDERFEKIGAPIFNKKAFYYLRDGTCWVEDGKGNAIFFKKNEKPMRDYLIKLHLANVRSLSDKEFLSTKYIIQAKLPGYKKLKEFMSYYINNRELEEIGREYQIRKIWHNYPVNL